MKKTFAAALLLAALLLSGCTVRQTSAETPRAPEPEKTIAVETASETPAPLASHVVRWYDGDTLLREETLPEGALPAAYVPEDTAPCLGWTDGSGATVVPESTAVTADADYYAAYGPTLRRDVTYMTAESGIFRPDDPLTRREAAVLLYALLPEPPALPEELPAEAQLPAPDAALDNTGMNGPTKNWEAANHPTAETDPRRETLRPLSALIAGGILPAGTEEDPLCSEQGVESETLLSALRPYFREGALEGAALSPVPTRLEIARLLNTLLEREAAAEYAFADLEAGSEAAAAASAACGETAVGSGMTLLSCGKLYYIENDAVLRDGDLGTLHFGADGAYTSGSEKLDELCRDAIIRRVNLHDSHERQLRSVYTYVRDRFAYLRRNYYDTGAHGWEIEEAETMLSSRYGNCYSYAAAFWALARAVGYDVRCISGTQGEHYAPHGWVWMDMEDGVRCFYDVEAEFAALRDGYNLNPMFRMTLGVQTNQWLYVFDWAGEGFDAG